MVYGCIRSRSLLCAQHLSVIAKDLGGQSAAGGAASPLRFSYPHYLTLTQGGEGGGGAMDSNERAFTLFMKGSRGGGVKPFSYSMEYQNIVSSIAKNNLPIHERNFKSTSTLLSNPKCITDIKTSVTNVLNNTKQKI